MLAPPLAEAATQQQQPLPATHTPPQAQAPVDVPGMALLPHSFVSIDSFLDSVSTSAAVSGTPQARRLTDDATTPVLPPLGLSLDEEPDGLVLDGSSGSEPPAVDIFHYEPEPEPAPDRDADVHARGAPVPPPPPPVMSRAEHTRFARPPSELSSSGSSSHSSEPESGGAVFDVVHEVCGCLASPHHPSTHARRLH
jgi:hypothetical protein